MYNCNVITITLPENKVIDALDLADELSLLFRMKMSSSSVKSDLYMATFAFSFASLNDAV